jgi:hypothetical protein
MKGYFCYKKHQPRYKGIIKIKTIKEKLRVMEDIANQLTSGREIILNNVKDLQHSIEGGITTIKVR